MQPLSPRNLIVQTSTVIEEYQLDSIANLGASSINKMLKNEVDELKQTQATLINQSNDVVQKYLDKIMDILNRLDNFIFPTFNNLIKTPGISEILNNYQTIHKYYQDEARLIQEKFLSGTKLKIDLTSSIRSQNTDKTLDEIGILDSQLNNVNIESPDISDEEDLIISEKKEEDLSSAEEINFDIIFTKCHKDHWLVKDMNQLGICYKDGIGTIMNTMEAIKCFRKVSLIDKFIVDIDTKIESDKFKVDKDTQYEIAMACENEADCWLILAAQKGNEQAKLLLCDIRGFNELEKEINSTLNQNQKRELYRRS